MLIYPHIPKTAGTTMMEVLKQNYGQGYFRLKNEGRRLKWQEKPDSEKEKVTCLIGHFAYGIHEHVPDASQYVTFLRDPVERILSLYYYVRHKNHQLAPLLSQLTVGEFVESRTISDTNNGMVRFLSGRSDIGQVSPNGSVTRDDLILAKKNLSQFAVIGFVETFNESLRKFARIFRWENIRYVSKRINASRPSQTDLPNRTINLVKEYNTLDLELYEFAKELVGREPNEF